MIYMDNAATTKICGKARVAMEPYIRERYGNPSGRYELGRMSRREIEKSRSIIAECIGAKPGEIYFTSGGTESDNWALNSVIQKNKINEHRPHIITTAIEHKAILNTCEMLKHQGVRVSYIPVDTKGTTLINTLEDEICKETVLISIMYANNEIGTIEPISEIGKITKANNIIFHTDAVQAFAHIPIDVRKNGIDMLSASGHKFGGPKGVGFLYVNNDLDIEPYICGGEQEMGKRSGTENVAGIVAMAAAAKYHCDNIKLIADKERYLSRYIVTGLQKNIEDIEVNGCMDNRLPGNTSVRIKGVNGAKVVEMLDKYGICISAGSACSAKNSKASHVLTAIGLDEDTAKSTVRITVSHENTRVEADILIHRMKEVINILRS